MLSPRGSRLSGAHLRMCAVAVALVALGPALGACQMRPLYGTTSSGTSVRDAMAAVDIGPIPGRVGQRLRNELIFDTTGGGTPPTPEYHLQIAIQQSVSSTLVRLSGDAQGQQYNLSANFQLIDAKNNKVVFKGSTAARAAYDKFEQIFANTRARLDAENRAAREVAEAIRTRVAAYLSRDT